MYVKIANLDLNFVEITGVGRIAPALTLHTAGGHCLGLLAKQAGEPRLKLYLNPFPVALQLLIISSSWKPILKVIWQGVREASLIGWETGRSLVMKMAMVMDVMMMKNDDDDEVDDDDDIYIMVRCLYVCNVFAYFHVCV